MQAVTPPSAPLPFTPGGEFRSAASEARYRAERLPETLRHVQLAFFGAFAVNVLFYLSDWRFFGQPHFPAALAARTAIVAASLLCLGLAGRVRAFPQLDRLCAGWSVPVIAAGAVLVTPHTDVALFIIFVLPVIFYLALPMSFPRTLATGLGCSAATLAGYLSQAPVRDTAVGLGLAMLTENVVLALLLIRANRLQRLAWDATRAARAAGEDLAQHRQALQTVLQAVPAPLVIVARDSRRVLEANDAARAFFGEAACQGRPALDSFFDRKELARLAGRLRDLGHAEEFETRLSWPDGTARDVLLAARRILFGSVEAVVAIVMDITGRKEMEAHLQLLANTDPLTGLANRARFFAAASAAIRRAQREGRPLSVVMLDLDHFKAINDTHGHEAGDAFLKALAGLCRDLLRGQDLAARIGGEEFALLLPDTDKAGALALADRLRLATAGRPLPGLDRTVTLSAGVSEVRPGETTVDAVLSRADQALYAAKHAGRNHVLVYEDLLIPDALKN
uniref:diguanylate cyclase n=1 Tax=Desulfovibrio sp. U5L TaxID=596152 RepID=I2Q437_9BACT